MRAAAEKHDLKGTTVVSGVSSASERRGDTDVIVTCRELLALRLVFARAFCFDASLDARNRVRSNIFNND